MSTAQTQPGTAAVGTTVRAEPTRTLLREAKTRTYLGMAWRRFRRNKLAMIGLVVLIFVILTALGAGLISDYITHKTPHEQSLRDKFAGINQKGYILGSDDLGRDTLTRLVYGGRVSLSVAGLAVLTALTIGAVVGVVAGFYG